MLENENLNVTNQSRKDLFKLAQRDETIHDTKFETKPVTYLQDCFRRFVKNKASVVAAIIIMLIGIFAIFEPMLDPKNHFNDDDFVNGEFKDPNFDCLTPKNVIFEGTGFWDGTKVETMDKTTYEFNKYNDSNYDMIIEEWSYITKTVNCDIVVLDMNLLDTRCENKNLVGRFIADIVLQILSFVAENERNNIKQRQAEGIKLAKEKGVVFGRPKIKLPNNYKSVVRQLSNKEINLVTALNKTKMSKSTFYKYMNTID